MNLTARLKEKFPWLGTDRGVSGADTIERLANWYSELLSAEDASLTEDDRRSESVEMRLRSHNARLRALDVELEAIEDRVKRLEGRGS
jgi:hypothetical protein